MSALKKGSHSSSVAFKILIHMILIALVSVFMNSQTIAQDKDKIETGIKKVYEMFSNGNLNDLDKYFDASFVEHTPGPGQKEGIAGLKEFMTGFKKSFPDLKLTVNELIISGNTASARCTVSGTMKGEFMGMPATNKSFTIGGVDWMVFNKDNKCTEHWGYEDDISWMQQLGLMK